MKRSLLDMTYENLQAAVGEFDKSKFRVKQIRDWLYKGASFDEMNNVPKRLREDLSEKYVTGHGKIFEKHVSNIDGTVKYLFELHDGVLVEGVVMHYKYGSTLCMSTQAGCNMACTFCSSALDGKTRDLSDGDMLAQVIAVIKDLGGERPIKNIVLMGSGEPFDNYNNTVSFLRRVNSEDGLNIGWRNISLSTCGLLDEMYSFAEEDIPVTLCVSLHAGNDDTRKKIMPIAKKYNIHDTIDAAKNYFEKTGRRVIIEYTLIRGVNDDEKNAKDLIKLIRDLNCNVNIIKLNEGRKGIESSSKKSSDDFIRILERNKINATLRRNMGSDIQGACGQLRHKVMGELNE